MKKRAIWTEIKRQLTNTPSYSSRMLELQPLYYDRLDQLNEQIEKAFNDPDRRMIFLIGPFGSGKTTQIHYFLEKHPTLRRVYKSLVKINALDFAFLHMTNYWSRFYSLSFFLLLGLLIMWTIPGSAALPFLFTTAYFFVKNVGNLVYIIHEACDNFFKGENRLVILDDLERSSLSAADQWALLANLWQLKRKYLISLGYPPDDKKAKLQIIENVQKLGGILVEVTPYKKLNFALIKKIDPDFPFTIDEKETSEKGDWISLFTFREMLMLKEQTHLRVIPHVTHENKQRIYVHVCLEFLLDKLGLTKQQIAYDDQTCSLKQDSLSKLSPEQAYFISSFNDSLQKH